MTHPPPQILEVAIPSPLRRRFDYLPPAGCDDPIAIGSRVQVPFAGQTLVGVVMACKPGSEVPAPQLKSAIAVLDRLPVLDSQLIELMAWASDYYQHPIGECISTALPNTLRKGLPVPTLEITCWRAASLADTQTLPARATRQQQLLQHLQQHGPASEHQLRQQGFSLRQLQQLHDRQLAERFTASPPVIREVTVQPGNIRLNDEQQAICDEFRQHPGGFATFLLEGITGSGKTEVYLQLIAHTLAQGRQALVLVPEIGLTPQTIERFRQRFDCPLAIFHSSLSDRQRLQHWQQARSGQARIIIGTRSALFTATTELGLIIVDEEHDLSYKQQDGLRYSARDMACMRAKLADVPVVLASATPTLESLHNAQTGKYRRWQLTRRAGDAAPPAIDIIDMRRQPLHDGIAEPALQSLQECLDKGEQALLFINRRGFAPSLICHDCGWIAQCPACDARFTVHQQAGQLRCHHCNTSQPIPRHCPECHSLSLIRTGVGTERIEQGLRSLFPDYPVFRIDRDTTARKGAMQAMLAQIHQQQAALLVGTQMLAKGHHFPNVTRVLIVDADQSLGGTDFRAIERFGQLITQVTGRAGRADKPGRALIQTHFPDHPQLARLVNRGYHSFALDLLAERRLLQLPPFSYQALVRLEDKDPQLATQTLQKLRQAVAGLPCLVIGPFPASLQRRAWYYRYQLLLQAGSRQQLKQAVATLINAADGIVRPHRQRWSVDIDPQDMS
ncbi:MAG TPA: primosomal protein N' [Pseudomonadales bacterium]